MNQIQYTIKKPIIFMPKFLLRCSSNWPCRPKQIIIVCSKNFHFNRIHCKYSSLITEDVCALKRDFNKSKQYAQKLVLVSQIASGDFYHMHDTVLFNLTQLKS